MWSSARTGSPSIQAHGGPQTKARRFADDAQDFPDSPRCSGRRGPDADHDPAAHRVRRRARASGGRRHLSAAQPVRRRVRARARRLCREAGRRQADRIGDQRHAGRPRSAFQLHGLQELPRHAGADPRRVRRARHRGHHGGRPDQGRGADRRDAGGQGRHHGQRHHHPSRRRAGAGPHPQPGGREDARPGEHQDQAQGHAQGPGQADRDLDHPRHHPRALGALAHRGRRRRLHPRHPVQRADHRRPEEGDRRSLDPGRRQAQGLRRRPAQQSGRPARSGDLGVRRVPGEGRDRLDPRPQRRGDPALQRPRRRPHQGASRSSC